MRAFGSPNLASALLAFSGSISLDQHLDTTDSGANSDGDFENLNGIRQAKEESVRLDFVEFIPIKK